MLCLAAFSLATRESLPKSTELFVHRCSKCFFVKKRDFWGRASLWTTSIAMSKKWLEQDNHKPVDCRLSNGIRWENNTPKSVKRWKSASWRATPERKETFNKFASWNVAFRTEAPLLPSNRKINRDDSLTHFYTITPLHQLVALTCQ